ncbi:MAG TPA: short-chain dehydrogenase/reductase [Vicinamibacteria bacterium]|nr:short-chain dehydrogenase/reductase [Vicinamibacteria bacterium]
MTPPLAGKVVLITGAARGIGAALARAATARGARMALAGLEPERLAALAAELGPGHAWFACDVTDQAGLEAAVAGAVEALGGLDVVVANAGIASQGTVAATPMAAMARVIDVNLTGVLRTVSATLPHVVRRRGYFLLISSAAALAAMPGLAAYAAAKSGVEQLGNALRLELAHKGVAVGSAHPCWIDTDLVRDVRHDLASFDALLRRLPGPFGRITSVEDCAEALVRAIERRRRRVFVPRSLALWWAARPLLGSRLGEALLRRQARRFLPILEQQVAALGRSFGEHSVEGRGTLVRDE